MKRYNQFFFGKSRPQRSFSQPKSKTVLFLTDSRTHNHDDTIFPMASHMASAYPTPSVPHNLNVYIVDRAVSRNEDFFTHPIETKETYGYAVQESYNHDTAAHYCKQQRMLTRLENSDVDMVFMMVDQPIDDQFLRDLAFTFPNAEFLNNPVAASHMGNKSYLAELYTQYPEIKNLMPRTALCQNVADVKAFAAENNGRIVLKTLKGYGGTGVKRYGANTSDWDIKTTYDLSSFMDKEGGACIAMQRLEHPEQADNRLIVVNGQIVGALKRTAAEGQFLCNMCAGGEAELAYPSPNEIALVRALSPLLMEKGLRFVGIDTLRHIDPETGEHRRYLSEINTLNTGGLSFMNELTGRKILETTTQMLVEDMLQKLKAPVKAPRLSQHYQLMSAIGS